MLNHFAQIAANPVTAQPMTQEEGKVQFTFWMCFLLEW